MSEIEYKLLENNRGYMQCDSCGSKVPLALFDWGPPYLKKRALCEVCFTTVISRITGLPDDLKAPEYQIAVLIAQATNHILSKMGKL